MARYHKRSFSFSLYNRGHATAAAKQRYEAYASIQMQLKSRPPSDKKPEGSKTCAVIYR